MSEIIFKYLQLTAAYFSVQQDRISKQQYPQGDIIEKYKKISVFMGGKNKGAILWISSQFFCSFLPLSFSNVIATLVWQHFMPELWL